MAVIRNALERLGLDDDPSYSTERVLAIAEAAKNEMCAKIRETNRKARKLFAVVNPDTNLAANTSTYNLPARWLSTLELKIKRKDGPDDTFRPIQHMPRPSYQFERVLGYYDEYQRTLYFSGGGWPYTTTLRLAYVGLPKKFVVKDNPDAAIETTTVDDILYPDWYLESAIMAELLRSDGDPGWQTQKEERDELRMDVLAQALATAPNTQPKTTPFRVRSLAHRRRI